MNKLDNLLYQLESLEHSEADEMELGTIEVHYESEDGRDSRPDIEINAIAREAKERIKKMKHAIWMATAGSCTCCTKTNEPAYHDEKCRYKALMKAIS